MGVGKVGRQGRAGAQTGLKHFFWTHWMIARRPSLTGEDILKLCREVVAWGKAFAQKSAGISFGDETLARLLVS